jgi:hypothetical protein
MLVFCVVTPCGVVGSYRCFGKTYCLHLQKWYIPTSPHGVATQKTNIDIFTAVKTSDLIYWVLRIGAEGF